jgi:hypothetical protein
MPAFAHIGIFSGDHSSRGGETRRWRISYAAACRLYLKLASW